MIQQHMDQYLCPSSLGATKQPSPLPQDRMIFTRCIYQLVMSITMLDVPTETLWFSLGSWLNQKVCDLTPSLLFNFILICPATKEHAKTDEFRRFRRQLFHSSLSLILRSLKPGMTTPEVMLFGDGHYRRVIFGLGPYIADYEEQVLLACIVRGWCARCAVVHINRFFWVLRVRLLDVLPIVVNLIRTRSTAARNIPRNWFRNCRKRTCLHQAHYGTSMGLLSS